MDGGRRGGLAFWPVTWRSRGFWVLPGWLDEAKILYPGRNSMCFRRLWPRTPREVRWGALLGLLGFLVAASVSAQDNVYTVSGVSVDVTAETATAAREAAIGQAQIGAAQALFRRLVMDQDLARLPELTADQVQPLVHDFSVSDERTAPGRYLATFTVRFDPAQVRGLFQQYGVRFAETQSKPLVVVPLWGGGSGAQLWEESNPWLRAWSAGNFTESLVPLIAPLGDLGDVTTVNAQQVLAGEPTPIGSLAARYRASGALVAQAVLLGNLEEGNATLAVTASRLQEDGLSKLGVLNVKQEPGEDLTALLDRAANEVAEATALRWKEANLLNFASRQTIPVTVPLESLDTWLQVRRRLDRTSTVIAIDLEYLRHDEARLNLTFVGSEEQLAGALAQHDLELVPGSSVGLGLERMPQPSGPGYGTGGMASGSPVLTPVEPRRVLRLVEPGSAAGVETPPALGAGSLSPSTEPMVEIQ